MIKHTFKGAPVNASMNNGEITLDASQQIEPEIISAQYRFGMQLNNNRRIFVVLDRAELIEMHFTIQHMLIHIG